MITSAAMNL